MRFGRFFTTSAKGSPVILNVFTSCGATEIVRIHQPAQVVGFVDMVLQGVERHRQDGDPPAWDILLELLPESRKELEALIRERCTQRLLEAGRPEKEPDGSPPWDLPF